MMFETSIGRKKPEPLMCARTKSLSTDLFFQLRRRPSITEFAAEAERCPNRHPLDEAEAINSFSNCNAMKRKTHTKEAWNREQAFLVPYWVCFNQMG